MLVWKLIAKWNSSSLVKLSGSFSFNSQNRSCSDEYLICAKKKQKQAITGTVRIGPIRARTPYPTSPRYQVRRYPTLWVSIATRATNPMATPTSNTTELFTTVRSSVILVYGFLLVDSGCLWLPLSSPKVYISSLFLCAIRSIYRHDDDDQPRARFRHFGGGPSSAPYQRIQIAGLWLWHVRHGNGIQQYQSIPNVSTSQLRRNSGQQWTATVGSGCRLHTKQVIKY